MSCGLIVKIFHSELNDSDLYFEYMKNDVGNVITYYQIWALGVEKN